jgi:putative FmdB family regulatory protein
MAHYDYRCTRKACSHTVTDLYQSIKDKPLTQCPKCKHHTFERVISGGILATVKDVNTIGSLLDKGQKDHKYKNQEIAHRQAEENPVNKEWHQSDKYRTATNREVARMTKAQRRKYVLEGKK